jgi:opacity protein-like surface antigen
MIIFTPANVHAGDEPFTYPAGWGGTGLMEIPTARVMRKDSWRAGFSQVDPIRTYYGTLSPLTGLEIGGRVTEYLHTRSDYEYGEWEGYGNQKDKAIDLKYQFLKERKYLPALAVGIMDPHGTRLQAAQYLVASKQIYPFDFTIGYGNGRYGKNPLPSSGEDFEIELFSEPDDWLDDAQAFYGIQFAPSDKFALMVEYSPIKIERLYRFDPDTHTKNKSKYNFGLRLKPIRWAQIDLSYQRGGEVGVNCSLAFDIGKPLIPIADIPYREKPDLQSSPFAVRLAAILSEEGFSDISVVQEDDAVWIEAQNDRYYYNTKAVAVVIRGLAATAPETVHTVNITLKENGIPLLKFTTTRTDLLEWYAERLSSSQYLGISRYETDVHKLRGLSGGDAWPFTYNIEPALQTFLNDPSGYFKYRLGARGWVAYHPWTGGAMVVGLEAYPLNNISTVNEPLSIPVRSDIAQYEKSRLALGRLMFDQIYKASHEVHARLAAGWLEIEYAGLDAEIAKPFLDGRLLLGVSGSLVKKREPDTVLAVTHDDDGIKRLYRTAFLDTRLNFPETGFVIDVKSGRFLAGDIGARITVSKNIQGVVVSAWYGMTDTAKFDDEYNRGYRDKGIAVMIPLRLFKGQDSKTSYHYALAPWTRDVAQDIHHRRTLFNFIGNNTQLDFRSQADEMRP